MSTVKELLRLMIGIPVIIMAMISGAMILIADKMITYINEVLR